MKCKNIYLEDAPTGSLVYPSTASSRSVNGGNYMERGARRPTPDSQLFPAIVLDPRLGQVLTPSGVKFISSWSLVSQVRHST